jgi:hypothetical protein
MKMIQGSRLNLEWDPWRTNKCSRVIQLAVAAERLAQETQTFTIDMFHGRHVYGIHVWYMMCWLYMARQ